jgi:hypothetical protein
VLHAIAGGHRGIGDARLTKLPPERAAATFFCQEQDMEV